MLSPAAKTVCVVLILLLTQLDCIASRPLPRALKMSDLQNHQMTIQSQLDESSNSLEKDEPMETINEIWNRNTLQPTEKRSPEPDDVMLTMHPRSVVTPVTSTQIITNESNVPSSEIPIDNPQPIGKEYVGEITNQMLLDTYFRKLRDDNDIEDYLICFGSDGVPYDVVDKFKQKPYRNTPVLCANENPAMYAVFLETIATNFL